MDFRGNKQLLSATVLAKWEYGAVFESSGVHERGTQYKNVHSKNAYGIWG